jgi:4-amino-4-deoxy-L-arabinose transferase-like glycosyltransferase
MATRVSGILASGLLGSIVLLAILLRVGFFVGLVSGDPQDDSIYYGNALALYSEGPQYLEHYRNLPADFLANPVDQFNVRPMVTYPIAASFVLFGAGEVPATLWALTCSILSVLVAYRLGFVLHGRTVGAIAALLCTFYPLEVINGTRILSDMQVELFSSVGLLLLVEARLRRSAVFYALSGTAAAGAYLANGRGLVLLIALLGCAVLLAVFRKGDWRAPVWILAGFMAIFSVEALIYYLRTGDALLNYHIQHGAARFKYLHEFVSSFRWGRLEVRYTNGQPFELVRSVLRLDDQPTNQFGLFFFLFFTSALFSLVRGRNLLLLAVTVGLSLYLELGPVLLSIDWPHREVQYMMVFKQERYLLMLTAPLVVLAAYFLQRVGRISRIAAIVLLLVLFVTSVGAIARTRNYYRAGLSDLRTIAELVRSNPDRTFFGDLWAVLDLRIFTRYQAQNLRVLDTRTTRDEVRHACVMLGGSRGVELLADYVESTLPAFAREILDTGKAPPEWRLVEEIKGRHNPQRRQDFKVYCVP